MEHNDNYDYLFKLLLAGEVGSGRTRFLIRYGDGKFEDNHYSTTDYDVRIKIITSHESNKRIKLQIWDVAGQERYRQVTSSYYRGTCGIFLLFDVTDRASFQSVNRFFEGINEYAPKYVQKILVATKIDETEKRVVTSEEAKALADQLGIPYIETSAKNDVNINEAVNMLVRSVEANWDKIQPGLPAESAHSEHSSQDKRCIIM